MPRIQPPAPKERPAILAASSAPSFSLTPPAAPPARATRKADDIGAIAFIVLVVLGLIAASRAFFLLGA